MPFQRLRYQADSVVAERISAVLEQCGAMAVTIENGGDDAFYEAAYPQTPAWRDLYVTGLFADDTALSGVVEAVNNELGGDLAFRIDHLDDQDWERAWLDNFRPLEVGPGLWICPGRSVPPEPTATNIFIDPGLAFGTGTHETTAMCLNWMAGAELAGATVCDYGCGSGILAVAALKLGAREAWGVDVDPRALTASAANAKRNGVAERFNARRPNEIPEGLQVDVVLANILAEVVMNLAEPLSSLVAPAGRLLLTGILRGQEGRVAARFAQSFELQSRYDGDWCLLIGTKR